METSVQIKNHELTLSTIQADTIDATQKLSDIYAETGKATDALAGIRSTHTSEESEMASKRSALAEAHLALDNRQKEMKGIEDRHTAELNVLLQQKHEASKELGRFNSWIATAEEELTAKRAEKADLDALLVGKTHLETLLNGLRNDVLAEHDKRDRVRLETSLLLDNTKAEVDQLLSKADDAKKQEQTSIAARDAAETERQFVNSEKARISSDLEIYIRRIEEHYQQAFPGLRMIL